jgi:hypothetical protein
VASVEADFDTKSATVTMQPGKTLTKAQCDQAFENTHYTVQSFDPVVAVK